MRHETWHANGRLAFRANDTTREVVRWDENGTEVERRPYNEQESIRADAASVEYNRETRYAALLERAEAAQQGNRDSRATLAQIAGATFTTTAQRDNAIKFLAGRVDALTQQNNALMQLVLRLAGRLSALDAPD